MKQRIITGAILALVLGLFVYFGEGKLEFLFSGLCVLLAVAAAFEFSRMINKEKQFSIFNYLSIPFTLIFTLLSVIFFKQDFYYMILFVFIISVILIYSLIFVFRDDFKKRDFSDQILTILYTSLGFIGFAFLRTVSIHLIIYLFIVAMITDVFAYFVGIKFGKTRLAPKISPKKSVEGAIGGLLFGSIAATLYAYYLGVFDLNISIIFVISIGLSIISQIGDLVASKFKREYNVKDYSNLFPGHGGVLDRFDSSSFASIFLMLIVMVIL